ncbi:ankyrin repeat domain-containing protein [Thalassotalea sp. G20_0]|uniref:ankyrin repeat domain-containing protein n=1 Tax=Thalassotalea sp. G20_0 TaxID=2821093 RepID=UPI001ADC0E34|nr:ankyrin repeat domain-containing protein [Thalassotalea sp. G20_0]MBO9492600.1 ankyrin repeat domain-containing protein [Thalassotalea sp. G20_0]
MITLLRVITNALFGAADELSPEDKNLLKAAGDGDLGSVKALLEQGADIEARDWSGRTPLFRAVMSENPEVLNVILAAGACLNARDCYGRTPLHKARSQKAVKELLAWGADIEARDNTGETPLFSADHRDSLEKRKVLLAAGACVNARDVLGQTPLHQAWSREIVNELLAWGADIEAKDNNKATPLICAITHRDDRLEAARALLFAGANIEAADEFQRTPLHLAASNKSHDLRYMEVLLSEGANLEARERTTQYTPLHKAVLSGSGKKVQVLVAEGANCKALDWHRGTPLQVANVIGKMDELLAATGRFDNIDSDNEPVSFQPQSLQACARTAIRSRLVKHRKNTGQPLSESVQDLPLDPTLKAYLYKPLMGTYL